MATKSAPKPKAPIVREVPAKEVIDATSTATATGLELAASFAAENLTRDERVFEQARIAFAGIATGAKPNDIAKATTLAVADTFPDTAREWAINTSVANGGAKVSRVTITQRADAFSAILNAGIKTPTVELVAVAFRAFTSKGAPGLADAHKRLITETLKKAEGERAAHYLNNARAVSNAVTSRKKAESDANRSEKAATASADKKAEKPNEGPVFATVEDVIAGIRAEVSRPWSDDDRAILMAALAEIVAGE